MSIGNESITGCALDGAARWAYAATVDLFTDTTVRTAVINTDRPGGVADAVEEIVVECWDVGYFPQ